MVSVKRGSSPSAMNGARSRSGATRRTQSERTELQLLQTATWLFSERGFHGTGIRDIADASGLAVSAMYYYASSKDELLTAIMRLGLTRLVDGSRQALLDLSGASERLATLVGFHVAYHARNPRTTRVVDQEFRALEGKAAREIHGLRDAYEDVWSRVLEEGVAEGEFVDRGRVSRLALLQMCTGVAHWYNPRGELSVAQLCERFADMSLALVGAHREGIPTAVRDLAVPSADTFLSLVDLATEPRRSRSRA